MALEPAHARAMLQAFERDGVVRVAGAIAPDDVREMRGCVAERIAMVELVENAGALRPARGTELDLWAIGREPALAAVPAGFARAVGQVFGPGVWAQVEDELGGLVMPNLPCPGTAWSVCGAAWHVDEPTPPAPAPGQVLIGFAYLDRVEPRGGATFVLAGSHHRLASLAAQLGTPVATDSALAALANEPWFADLVRSDDPDAAPGPGEGWVSAGIPLRVVELTGEPGDIVLLNPRCLHTISANVSARPRLTTRVTGIRL